MLLSILTSLMIFVIIFSVALTSLIGLLVVYHVVRRQNHPADQSNRFNKMRLVWFALTREELFIDTFNWMRKDELENVNND